MSGKKIQVPLAVATNLVLELLIQATKVNAAVSAAQMRGDSNLSIEELDSIRKDRDAAFSRLDQDIANATPPADVRPGPGHGGVPIETPDDLKDGEDNANASNN